MWLLNNDYDCQVEKHNHWTNTLDSVVIWLFNKFLLKFYVYAGDGKTHYIKEQLSASAKVKQLTIAVNEFFTPLKAIAKLCSLPTKTAAIFFNFTMFSPGVRLISC